MGGISFDWGGRFQKKLKDVGALPPPHVSSPRPMVSHEGLSVSTFYMVKSSEKILKWKSLPNSFKKLKNQFLMVPKLVIFIAC